MNVGELKEAIASMPDDAIVVMQEDDEGNGYRELRGIEFVPPGEDGTNYFDGSECFRKSDLDYYEREIDETLKICAVVY